MLLSGDRSVKDWPDDQVIEFEHNFVRTIKPATKYSKTAFENAFSDQPPSACNVKPSTITDVKGIVRAVYLGTEPNTERVELIRDHGYTSLKHHLTAAKSVDPLLASLCFNKLLKEDSGMQVDVNLFDIAETRDFAATLPLPVPGSKPTTRCGASSSAQTPIANASSNASNARRSLRGIL